MEFKKNDSVTVSVTDMGQDGEGIGKAEGYTLFIKDAVVGDKVRAKVIKAKKNYGYARLMEVLEPSPDRVEPRCSCARQCGGCQIQALSYQRQLQFKEEKVRNVLERIGGFEKIPLQPIIGMENPYRYRNKAQFPIGTDREGRPIAGFYAGRTHTIIPQEDCVLGVRENKAILEVILGFMEEFSIPAYREEEGSGLVRHVLIRYGFATKEIMVCVVINGDRLPKAEILAERLSDIAGMTSISINKNKRRTNVILGEEVEVIWGRPFIEDVLDGVRYQISPLSFYQVNPVQTKVLYEKALQYAGLHGTETVWDLYCGIGTISLFLARQAGKVYGVEIVPQAIEDARRNAALNGMENVEFMVGKAEEILPEKYEKEGVSADVIVVDPPRKGCDPELLDTMLQIRPKRIVYVSCDPATLARDLRLLCAGGYKLQKVQPVDQFPHSVHVETVCLLSREKSVKRYVHVDVTPEELGMRGKSKNVKHPTYPQIREYVKEKHGLTVSSANIASVKDECGMEKQFSYKEAGMAAKKRPNCPKKKRDAIVEAFVHFGMLSQSDAEALDA